MFFPAMGAFGSPAVATPKPQTGPHACLRKGDARAWCPREPDKTDFLFQDADYAAEHYDRRTCRMASNVPAACEKCVDAMRAAREHR